MRQESSGLLHLATTSAGRADRHLSVVRGRYAVVLMSRGHSKPPLICKQRQGEQEVKVWSARRLGGLCEQLKPNQAETWHRRRPQEYVGLDVRRLSRSVLDREICGMQTGHRGPKIFDFDFNNFQSIHQKIKDGGKNDRPTRILTSKMDQNSCKQRRHRCCGHEEAGAGKTGSDELIIDDL